MAQHSSPKQSGSAALILTVLVVALVAFAGGYLVGGQNSKLGSAPDMAAVGASSALVQNRGAIMGIKSTIKDSPMIPVGNSYVLGNPNAPITVVEFSDFQCPYCQRGAATAKQLVDKYPNDVRVVFKHNPLPFHKQAPDASVAAMAAGQQGKFWEMHDLLFDNYKKFKGADMKALTTGYAKQLGLDVAAYQKDFDNPQFRQVVKDDLALGSKLGVRGTPNFLINGERLVGAQPLNKFEEVIKKQLAEIRKMGSDKSNVYVTMVKKNFKKTAPPKPRGPAPSTVNMVPVSPADNIKGNLKDPLITIIEFSDFQCPYCQRGNNTISEVMKQYGSQARLVFKNLPLPFHKEAPAAHKGAMAAGLQGKFWEMNDKLFANYKNFKGADMDALLEGYAKELGLNVAKFKTDYASPAIAKQLKDDMALAAKVGARGTPNFFVNGVQLVGAQPKAKFDDLIKKQLAIAKKVKAQKKLSGDALYTEIVAYNKKNAPKAPARPAPPASKVDVKLLTVDNSPVMGPKNAPVTIYEFSDFQCPYCQRGANTIDQLKAKYPKRVKVVFKHNPLPFHKQAPAAHKASFAAAKQGKFSEMHDKLFANYKNFKNANMDELVAGYAKEIGLNVGQFQKDYTSPAAAAQLKRDMAMGAKVGVRGTPHFFVNGTRLSGAQPIASFEKAVETALKNLK